MHQRRFQSLFDPLVLVGALTIVICVVIFAPFIDRLFYFVRTGSIVMCEEIRSSSPQEIEAYAHVVFPPNSANIVMYSPEGCKSARHFFVRFQLDPSDLAEFIASTRVNVLSPENARPPTFAKIPDNLDWLIEAVKFGLAGSSPNSLDYQQDIGIDISDPNRYTVYFVATSYD